MSYFVTENCICCKYTQCVQVCPVDCFKEGVNFLVINKNECIDCGLCETECPINAIKQDIKTNIQYININNHFSKKLEKLTKQKTKLPYAEIWKNKKNKTKYIQIKLLELDSNQQPNG